MAENHHRRGAGLVFGGGKGSAVEGGHAEGFKVVPGDRLANDAII